jgi:hypothetical protein
MHNGSHGPHLVKRARMPNEGWCKKKKIDISETREGIDHGHQPAGQIRRVGVEEQREIIQLGIRSSSSHETRAEQGIITITRSQAERGWKTRNGNFTIAVYKRGERSMGRRSQGSPGGKGHADKEWGPLSLLTRSKVPDTQGA